MCLFAMVGITGLWFVFHSLSPFLHTPTPLPLMSHHPTIRVAISMACRLRFCRKLDRGAGGGEGEDASGVSGALASPTTAALAGGLEALDLDAMLRSPELQPLESPSVDPQQRLAGFPSAAAGGGGGGGEGGQGVAFVVDAEVTC